MKKKKLDVGQILGIGVFLDRVSGDLGGDLWRMLAGILDDVYRF